MSWICIDFGTCNTAAAIVVDGKPHVVSAAAGYDHHFPTVACVSEDGINVCQEAEPLRQVLPEYYIQEFKLQIDEELNLNGKQYVDVVKEILSYVRNCAISDNNKAAIDSAILTIPAVYVDNDDRIEIMRQAAYGAGFTTVEFMSEPKAAALHYSHIIGKKSTGLSLIYDLGGGTFDPSLLDMTDYKNPKLLGEENGIRCGGQYFDRAIYKHLCSECEKSGIPLMPEKKLDDYQACRRIKESLSGRDRAQMMFSNRKLLSLDRSTFEGLIKDNVALTFKACDSLLKSANKKWNDVSQVLLVGGSTSIPYISESLQKHLLSYNAKDTRIIKTLSGDNGDYDQCFATCLGGIVTKIAPPPPPEKKIGTLLVNGKILQLKEGLNTFGRGDKVDFSFSDDPTMSRLHFNIRVTKDASNRWNYFITTCSTTKSTVLNNTEALDIAHFPISRKSSELHDGWTIIAGHTKFQFKAE